MDLMQTLTEIQPALTALSALLSIAVLGFIVRFALLMRAYLSEQTKAVEEQKRVVEERLLSAKADLERTEKWHSREKDELQSKLDALLREGNVSVASLVSNPTGPALAEEIRQAVQSTLQRMVELEARASDVERDSAGPEWHLKMAQGLGVSGDWTASARHYDRVLEEDPDNWRMHFLRAVAYANSRGGSASDVSSLRSYGEAIALAPADVDDRTRARLHSYRGAMAKRLSRLPEARADLELALGWAPPDSYESTDAIYNLACVYAMEGNRDIALEYIRRLPKTARWKQILRARRVYFENLWQDPEFRELIGLGPVPGGGERVD